MNNILMDNVINIINESKSLVLEVKNNLIINIFNENDISLEVLINECGNSEVFSDKEYRYAYKKSKILLSKRC